MTQRGDVSRYGRPVKSTLLVKEKMKVWGQLEVVFYFNATLSCFRAMKETPRHTYTGGEKMPSKGKAELTILQAVLVSVVC